MGYDYGAKSCNELMHVGTRAPTIRESVEDELRHLRTRVAEKEELLKILDENPEIERALTLLRG